MDNGNPLIEWENGPTPAAPEPLEIFPATPPKPVLPPETVKDRATKAHIAAGPDSPGIDALIDQMQSGLEDDIRAGIANREYLKKQKQSQDLVSEYFSNKGMVADDPGEIAYVQHLSQTQPDRLSTIIEKKYAENRVGLSLASDTSGAVERVTEKNPDKMDATALRASSLIAAKEQAKTAKDNLEALYGQTGFFRGVVDFAKGAIPMLTTYEVANVGPEGTETEGFAVTKGTILLQKIRKYYSMTLDERGDYLQKLTEEAVADPSKFVPAIELVSAFESYSHQQAQLDNAMNYIEGGLEVTPLGVVGPVLKSGVSAVGKTVAKRGLKAAAEAAVAGETDNAAEVVAKSVFEAADTPQVPNADGLVPAAPIVNNLESSADNVISLVDAKAEIGKAQTKQRVKEIVFKMSGNDIETLVADISKADWGSISKVPPWLQKDFNEWLKDTYGLVDSETAVAPENMAETVQRFMEENAEYIQSDILDVAANSNTRVAIDVPNPATGETVKAAVPVTDETLAAAQVEAATKDAMKETIDPVESMAIHGDAEGAASLEAVNRVVEDLGGVPKASGDIQQLSTSLRRKLSSILDPFTRIVGTAPTKEHYKEVIKLGERFASVIKKNVTLSKTLLKAWEEARSTGAIRVSSETFEKVKPILDEQFRKEFSSASDGILDIETRYLRETDADGLRRNGAVYTLGKPSKGYFSDAKNAKYYAEEVYKLPQGYYNIVPRGSSGFALEVTRVMDETNPAFAKLLINTKTKTPVSFASAFTSYLKGGMATASDLLGENLKVSAHHANALHKAFSEAAKEIGTLTKAEKENLDVLMAAMRDYVTKDAKGDIVARGRWANNAIQFEQMYKRAFKTLPTEAQTNAYFAIRQLHDFDMITRNMILYTDMARMGIEEFQFYLPVVTDAIPEQGIEVTTKWMKHQSTVLAKAVDELPANQLDNDIFVIDAEGKTTKLINKAKDGTAAVDEYLGKGYKLYKLSNPNERPFKALNDNYIQYVVARDVERRPLSLDRLPYTEGGHVRTAESFFVKQAGFETTSNGSRLYLGDKVMSGHSSQAEATKFAAAMEKARNLMLAGDDKLLADHLAANTPYDINEFKALFEPYMNPDGTVGREATFSKEIPFGWVADGQGMNDAAKAHMPELRSHFEGIKDTIDDPNNDFRLLGKKYTGQKDQMLRTIVEGDNGRAWKFQDARHISPLALLEDSAADLSRLLSLNDLKHSAAMHWVEEAAPYLETPLDELRSDPWSHFLNPQWKGQYTDIAAVRALKAQQTNTLGFMGLAKNPMDSTTDWVRMKLMNSVYEKFGGQKADWVDEHLLPSIKNPIQYMRAFAFHTKLGFFNPVQLFLQTQTMFHTFAVTGNLQRVGSALSGLTLSQAARFSSKPEILAALDKKAQKLGWKAGEWLESHNLLKKLKLDMVEGETGYLDMTSSPSIFQSKFGKFLDKGTIFFKEAERAVRVNAWHVAYKEFRDKFPTKVIGNEEINAIMKRQELLTVNMTKAGNAWWQRGLSGPATQFMGYQARIAEQLLGKQLTRAEKLRVGIAYAGLYGVPVSLGAATFMQVPGASSDDIREYALKNGIDVDRGLTGLAMNGIPASLIYWMTSDENGQNGYQFDIGQRVGPGGLTVLKDLAKGDKSLFDIALGASFTIGKDFLKTVYPDDGDILGAMTDAPSKSLSDYANVFSTISTVNNTNKLLWALFTHRNMTRNGVDLGEIDSTSAVIRYLTGLEEQRFLDSYLKMDIMADLTDYNKEIGKEYRRQYQQMMKLPIGSKERDEAIRKAKALLEGVDPATRSKILWQARQPEKPLDESIDKSFTDKVLKPKGIN